jgi:hypothetical protein
MVDFSIPQGTELPQITATLTDENGPIDLSGGSVRLQMRAPGTDQLTVLDANASVLNPATAGRVSYQWIAGDTTHPRGLYVAWFLVDYAGVAQLEAPNPRLVIEIT